MKIEFDDFFFWIFQKVWRRPLASKNEITYMITQLWAIMHSIPFLIHSINKMIETGFVIVKDQNIFSSMNQFLHHQILRSSVKLIFRSHNSLQKSEVLNMSSVCFCKGISSLVSIFLKFSRNGICHKINAKNHEIEK